MQRFKPRSGLGWLIKEVLVASGRAGDESRAGVGYVELIPVDSEHNGAHQCFRAGSQE